MDGEILKNVGIIIIISMIIVFLYLIGRGVASFFSSIENISEDVIETVATLYHEVISTIKDCYDIIWSPNHIHSWWEYIPIVTLTEALYAWYHVPVRELDYMEFYDSNYSKDLTALSHIELDAMLDGFHRRVCKWYVTQPEKAHRIAQIIMVRHVLYDRAAWLNRAWVEDTTTPIYYFLEMEPPPSGNSISNYFTKPQVLSLGTDHCIWFSPLFWGKEEHIDDDTCIYSHLMYMLWFKYRFGIDGRRLCYIPIWDEHDERIKKFKPKFMAAIGKFGYNYIPVDDMFPTTNPRDLKPLIKYFNEFESQPQWTTNKLPKNRFTNFKPIAQMLEKEKFHFSLGGIGEYVNWWISTERHKLLTQMTSEELDAMYVAFEQRVEAEFKSDENADVLVKMLRTRRQFRALSTNGHVRDHLKTDRLYNVYFLEEAINEKGRISNYFDNTVALSIAKRCGFIFAPFRTVFEINESNRFDHVFHYEQLIFMLWFHYRFPKRVLLYLAVYDIGNVQTSSQITLMFQSQFKKLLKRFKYKYDTIPKLSGVNARAGIGQDLLIAYLESFRKGKSRQSVLSVAINFQSLYTDGHTFTRLGTA